MSQLQGVDPRAGLPKLRQPWVERRRAAGEKVRCPICSAVVRVLLTSHLASPHTPSVFVTQSCGRAHSSYDFDGRSSSCDPSLMRLPHTCNHGTRADSWLFAVLQVVTQMHYARAGTITEEMAFVAAREGMDPGFVRSEVCKTVNIHAGHSAQLVAKRKAVFDG